MRKQLQTYFVTTVTEGRRALLQSNQNADLMIDTLLHYRDEGRYALHAFVVMPDHIHAILTPAENQSLERCMQCIKGGYSHAHPSKSSIWQRGFHEHRLRDVEDYMRHITYIIQNPGKRGLREHRHVHMAYTERLDPTPEHLRG